MQLLSDHFVLWAKERNVSPASMVETADLRFFADKLLALAEEMDGDLLDAKAESSKAASLEEG